MKHRILLEVVPALALLGLLAAVAGFQTSASIAVTALVVWLAASSPALAAYWREVRPDGLGVLVAVPGLVTPLAGRSYWTTGSFRARGWYDISATFSFVMTICLLFAGHPDWPMTWTAIGALALAGFGVAVRVRRRRLRASA